MVNSVQLFFFKEGPQVFLQLPGRGQVVAERFLYDYTGDAILCVHTTLDLLGHRQKNAWRQGQIEETVWDIDVGTFLEFLDLRS